MRQEPANISTLTPETETSGDYTAAKRDIDAKTNRQSDADEERILKVGQPVRVRMKNAQDKEVEYSCEVTEETTDYCRMSLRREGAMFARIQPKSPLTMFVTMGALLNSISGEITEVKRERLTYDFKVQFNDYWRVLTRRAAIRAKVNLEANLIKVKDWQSGARHSLPGCIEDISVKGARIFSRVPMKLGELLVVQAQLPYTIGTLVFICQVVRLHAKKNVNQSSEFGTQIIKISHENLKLLELFIEDANNGQS